MKILVLTPVWKRPEITEAYCLGILRLKRSFDLDVLCVLSDEDVTHGHRLNHELMAKYGINYVSHKNKLGAKKNFGLNEAMKLEFDYLMEMNSDDIILDQLFHAYADLMEKGESFIGLGNFVFYNSETGEAKQPSIDTTNTVFGIGRVYSRAALESSMNLKVRVLEPYSTEDNLFRKNEIKWVLPHEVIPDKVEILDKAYCLWDDEADYGMDNESARRFCRVGILPKVVKTEEPMAMDVKSKVNIWSFHDMSGDGYDSRKFINKLDDVEKRYLNDLRVK